MKKIFLTALVLMTMAIGAMAQKPVKVSVDLNSSAGDVTPDFGGLSYETKTMIPDGTGRRYFNPADKALIDVMRQLGVKSVRIGGNSCDESPVRLPNFEDIDYLCKLARKAGVKLIYSVRLKHGDSANATKIIKYIHDNYNDVLDYVAIGNEPNGYYRDFEQELGPEWQRIFEAINKEVPGLRYVAPDDNPRPVQFKNIWNRFGSDKGGPVEMLSMHNYPADCAYRNPSAKDHSELIPCDAGEKRELMLSPDFHVTYDGIYAKMEETIGHHPFRLTECNSIWYGGLKDASDSYASALWGLDFMYYWAMHGSRGTNFHTGDSVGGGMKQIISRYAAFVTEGKGYDIRPLSYAMKMFSLVGAGTLHKTDVSGTGVHMYAYAVKNDEGLNVVLMNMSHGTTAEQYDVTLPLTAKNGKVMTMLMTTPDGDIARHKGVTIGGKSISPVGKWNGKWQKARTNAEGSVTVSVPAASAMIVRIK